MSASINYNLHQLGWHSFQQLCLSITRDILGQTVESFLDTNDAGKDGAFAGKWKPTGKETIEGKFVIQCKFTAKFESNLTLSDLTDELPKVERLIKAGRCDCYVILTNAGISGQQDEIIKEKFKALGVKHTLIFGSTWICQQIHESKSLRTSVPRLYGLGDLSQILDQRAYDQAKELLASLRDELAKIVITDSYNKALKALNKHSFVLLIGEPAAGKTTIASMLAMSALDQWGAFTVKVDRPDEVVARWNSINPAQFFWIDDAFGVTQYESSLVNSWNHIFPQVKAMLKQGVKIVMTSRDYIYNRARNDLKEGAFPLLQEGQVVIDVHNLSLEEKKQILYNHLKLGKQTKKFLSAIKPHLDYVASHPRFIPETARRLSEPIFTEGLIFHEYTLNEYIDKQERFLQEVIKGLDIDSKAALALIYMRNGQLESPITLTGIENPAIERLGSSVAGVIQSLLALKGGMVQHVTLNDNSFWRFKHPTIGDSYASILIENPEWLEIYITGTSTEKLIDQITCGDVGVQRAVIIPQNYYKAILERLSDFKTTDKYKTSFFSSWGATSALYGFLARRCSKDFLKIYIAANPEVLKVISDPSLYFSASSEVILVVRLHELDLLPDEERKNFVNRLTQCAIDGRDIYALKNDNVRTVFNEDELRILQDRVYTELIPNLDKIRDDFESSYKEKDDPEDHMDDYLGMLKTLEKVYNLPDVDDVVSSERKKAEDWIEEKSQDENRGLPKRNLNKIKSTPDFTSTRSIFDDVDE
ncbi:hypothetical protein [Niastella populi]|uniref:Novel STAND NTPase 3 domain-containing protein n=1 Tax=Niastella populi TaxID=550983 RepID=A0A1V9FGW9_9BACT|nr:hypothetical protein [Niastella populi]OQP57613.1 hypothetical protein A4R26_24095 [Niastella populi]